MHKYLQLYLLRRYKDVWGLGVDWAVWSDTGDRFNRERVCVWVGGCKTSRGECEETDGAKWADAAALRMWLAPRSHAVVTHVAHLSHLFKIILARNNPMIGF